ncbi:unnamed protein product [Sphenostylis stenocarpa]|uniref:Uncharacterized protein n=1 Tax=Sphenostylis stenocarpa TaxID=92480 RepID=A0AA86VUA4_9FABA|nr:unnamed protein product [Sphenostylis stenocarpa]
MSRVLDMWGCRVLGSQVKCRELCPLLCFMLGGLFGLLLVKLGNESEAESIIKRDSSAVATSMINEGKWSNLFCVRKLCTSEFG